jgi:hypothetical protein
MLIDAYPQIKDNKTLFLWEWTQCNNNDIDFLVKELREFVLYRMNYYIKDFEKDIPKYINHTYIHELFPKLNKHIDKKRFKTYYEWCCLSFPEYKDVWKPEDFGDTYTYDGIKCNSIEEKMLYEYIKRDLGYIYIKSIGINRKGKYTYKLDNSYDFQMFCPDFVIEYINFNNKKLLLNKPIIIEYYGLYNEQHNNHRFIKYRNKTNIKNSYYYSRNDILFMPIYPNELKNNRQIIQEKLKNVISTELSV